MLQGRSEPHKETFTDIPCITYIQQATYIPYIHTDTYINTYVDTHIHTSSLSSHIWIDC